jgi:Flp pilus assembly protein TadB
VGTVNAAAAVSLGGLFGLGVVAAIAGFAGLVPPRPSSSSRVLSGGDRLLTRATLTVVATTVVYAWTAWLVAAMFAGAAAALAPGVLDRRRVRRQAMARTEAIAGWAEMVRDTLAAAAGIQEALVTTAPVAPPPIRADVSRLARRLQSDPFSDALRDFAARLDDPVGDLVVAALLVAGERQAGNLRDILTAAATSARATATMRLRVETGRARTWTSVRVTVGVFGIVAVGLVTLDRPYLQPFDNATGQLVLALVGGLLVTSLLLLSTLAGQRAPERVFAAVEAPR